MQLNGTVGMHSASKLYCARKLNFEKQPGAASQNSRVKREFTWTPLKIIAFLTYLNVLFAVVASNTEATTQTNGLISFMIG